MWLFKEIWFHRKKHYISVLTTSIAFFLVLTVSVLSKGLISEITDRIASLGTDNVMIEVLFDTGDESNLKKLD